MENLINPPNRVLAHKDITCIFYSFKNKLPQAYFQSKISKIENFENQQTNLYYIQDVQKWDIFGNTPNKLNNHSFDRQVASNACRNKRLSKNWNLRVLFLKIKIYFIDKNATVISRFKMMLSSAEFSPSFNSKNPA